MNNRKEDTQKIPIIFSEDYDLNKSNKIQKEKNAHNNKQQKNKYSKIIISIFLIITLIFTTTTVGFYSIFSRINYQPNKSGVEFNINNIKNSIYNILLIGTDKEDSGPSRSDTMILLSIDSRNKKIKMISFMRDLWIKIPNNNEGRLNSAYTIGGAELLLETLEYNFDIQIDNYMLVDFEMFKQLVDELDGVSVEITENEAKFINKTTKATVVSGENTLDGYEALVYCRIRKLDSDFMRTQRQRKVINAIINKIKKQSIIKTITAGYNILPLITTDISPTKMMLKTLSILSAMDYTVNQLRIPADNTYSNKTINAQAVLVADSNDNKRIIKDFILN